LEREGTGQFHGDIQGLAQKKPKAHAKHGIHPQRGGTRPQVTPAIGGVLGELASAPYELTGFLGGKRVSNASKKGGGGSGWILKSDLKTGRSRDFDEREKG